MDRASTREEERKEKIGLMPSLEIILCHCFTLLCTAYLLSTCFSMILDSLIDLYR